MSIPSAPCSDTSDCNADFSGLNVVCYAGVGCACDTSYALGGLNCLTQTPASRGTQISMFIAIGLIAATAVRFFPTWNRAFIRRRWKSDHAGLTYAFAWCAWLAVTFETICNIVLTFTWSTGWERSAQTFYVLDVGLLATSIMVMSVTYFDMAATIKIGIAFHRVRSLCVTVLAVVFAIGGALFALTPTNTFSLAVIVIFGLLIIGAVVGPFSLYVASATNMARTAGRAVPKKSSLLRACVIELTSGNRAMRRALGLYGTDSDDVDISGSKDSKGSKNSREGDDVKEKEQQSLAVESLNKRVSGMVTRMGSILRISLKNGKTNESEGASNTNRSLVSSVPQVQQGDVILNKPLASSSPLDAEAPAKLKKFFLETKSGHYASHMAHVRRRETSLVKFLGRSVRTNFFLSLALFGYILAAAACWQFDAIYDTSAVVKSFALAVAFRLYFFTIAVWQILWFFDVKYRRRPLISLVVGADADLAGFSRQISREGSRVPSAHGSFEVPPGASIEEFMTQANGEIAQVAEEDDVLDKKDENDDEKGVRVYEDDDIQVKNDKSPV